MKLGKLMAFVFVVVLAFYIQPAESVDTVPPVTTCTLDGTMVVPSTYTGTITIILTATDNGGSGVRETAYGVDMLNPGINAGYVKPVPIITPGSHTIYFQSWDNAGNRETLKSTSFTIVNPVDDPVTNITSTGALGEGGVYVSPVTVKLDATDNCSGVAKILCSLDDWNTTQTYILPFNVSAEGNTTVRCYAVDMAGNIGDEVSLKITIRTGNATVMPTVQPSITPTPTPIPTPGNDTTPPVTVVALNGKQGNGADFYTSDVQVMLVANDGTGSGINWTQYSQDNATWYRYVAPFTVNSEGMNTVYYYSVDNACNVEVIHAKTFAVAHSNQFKLPCLNALVLPLLCVCILAMGAARLRKGRR